MTLVPHPSAFCLRVISIPITPVEHHQLAVDGEGCPHLGALMRSLMLANRAA